MLCKVTSSWSSRLLEKSDWLEEFYQAFSLVITLTCELAGIFRVCFHVVLMLHCPTIIAPDLTQVTDEHWPKPPPPPKKDVARVDLEYIGPMLGQRMRQKQTNHVNLYESPVYFGPTLDQRSIFNKLSSKKHCDPRT